MSRMINQLKSITSRNGKQAMSSIYVFLHTHKFRVTHISYIQSTIPVNFPSSCVIV